ncbi:MAG TPA: biotin/lipoyl-containing protein, partial [Fontimonas sp.]
MANTIEVKVPDIGNYDGVPVIDVLIAVGDSVEKDQPLIVLESDKATMEVPAPSAGVVREIKAKLGDKMSEGQVICLLEAGAEEKAAAPAAKPAAEKAPAKAAAPAAAAASPKPAPAAKKP